MAMLEYKELKNLESKFIENDEKLKILKLEEIIYNVYVMFHEN